HVVAFDCPGRKTMTWEGLSCNRIPGRDQFDVHFYGENGSLAIRGGGYIVFDVRGRELRRENGDSTEALHFPTFLEACRGNGRLNSAIEEGHKSPLLCHLGNIAHRTGWTLRCDPRTGHILGDQEAMRLWSREYAPGWEPRV